jgi:hypothetical protein
MKLHFSNEWLRRKLADGLDDCPACSYCLLMAGCCNDYPNCPNGPIKETTMTTRCKLQLTEITEQHWGGAKKLRFQTVYDNTIPEDQRFQKATPSGHCELQVDNPAALAEMKLGQNYYVDFTPVG